MREVLSVPARAQTWRRWAHLIVGGAVLVPYTIVANAIARAIESPASIGAGIAVGFLVCGVALPVATGLLTAVRELEIVAARVLLHAPVPERPAGAPMSWAARRRSGAWFVVHLLAGGVVGSLTLTVPPVAAAACALPFGGDGYSFDVLGVTFHGGPARWWAPFAAIASVLALVHLASAIGALLARLAPRLLGPTPAERMAALERHAAQLAERNRLARELHDSVGHALSIVTIQASAAERVLDADPQFARRALREIGASARDGMRDLDHVLGLLRDEPAATAPALALPDIDRLLAATRSAGIDVTADVEGDIAGVPGALSREAYRIIQEGVTNAVRHAGDVPMHVHVAVGRDRLEVELTNPLSAGTRRPEGGGRGLVGIRERVAALRGRVSAGPDGGVWKVHVELPLRPAP